MVFDVPNHKGTYGERYTHLGMRWLPLATISNLPFPPPFAHPNTQENRIEELGLTNHSIIKLATKKECNDMKHMEKLFQDVIDQGGEGIILRNPTTPYQPGRSPGYLKHKVCLPRLALNHCWLNWTNSKKFRDAEAKVLNKTGAQQWECILYVLKCTLVIRL